MNLKHYGKYYIVNVVYLNEHQCIWNARQVAYLDRIIPRTEVATRITHMDSAYLSRVATKWFWDKETTVSAWGPLHNVINMCHYNRPYKRATLG